MFGKPVFLLIDILIFGLVLCIVAFFLYAMRKPHLRQPWRQVVRSKSGVISMMILLLYVTIALLDSLHFYPRLEKKYESSSEVQYSGEVVSLFDQMVSSLRESSEKTYSAPFAAHLYAKETVQLPDGTKQRAYPRLSWGGVHLGNPQKEKNHGHIQVSFNRRNQGHCCLGWIGCNVVFSILLSKRKLHLVLF